MKVRFWGVRGSLPTPVSRKVIQDKITAVVQRITAEDIETPEKRELFLSRLPDYLFGTVGGNTPCIEIQVSNDTLIILDAGSGIRELGVQIKKKMPKVRNLHIFFSHFHYDHIMGLPFFPPAYDPKVTIHFYSPIPNFEEILRGQMHPPYFPVEMKVMYADLYFHVLSEKQIDIQNTVVEYLQRSHPGESFAYKINGPSKNIIYSTDTELSEEDFKKNEKNISFFQNTDIIILDSQYTLGEAIEKFNWGHSSYSMAVDFAVEWGMEKLLLYHHEPLYDDQKLYTILKSARWYLEHIGGSGLDIDLAIEGKDLDI